MIIPGLMFGVVLIYFWLIGHWFARVLVWPLMAWGIALAILVSTTEVTGIRTNGNTVVLIAIVVPSFVSAWFLSGFPMYYHARHSGGLSGR